MSFNLKIPPLLLALIFAALMTLMAWAAPAFAWVRGDFDGLLAMMIALLGAGICGAGVLAFKDAGTTVDPRTPEKANELVVRGIYRISRNPMYLGFLLILAAWAMWLSNGLCFVALPLFVAYLNRFQIGPEEVALHAKFGESYVRYMRQVRRWL